MEDNLVVVLRHLWDHLWNQVGSGGIIYRWVVREIVGRLVDCTKLPRVYMWRDEDSGEVDSASAFAAAIACWGIATESVYLVRDRAEHVGGSNLLEFGGAGCDAARSPSYSEFYQHLW